MQIWVDGDACPKLIKEILYRAANRTKVMLILVANQWLATPPSPYIKKLQVASGFDVADNYIIREVQPEDLVITADIPLANAVIEKGATALNPRGELYTERNIKQRLARRDYSESLRSTGAMTHGPDKISKKELQAFANMLDKFLAQALR